MANRVEESFRRAEQRIVAERQSAPDKISQAGEYARKIMALCGGEDATISGSITAKKYPPSPTDIGRVPDQPPEHVNYYVSGGLLPNRQRLPVDGSAEFAAEFLDHCERGLPELVAEQVARDLKRAGL
jgi:hypothetical protein